MLVASAQARRPRRACYLDVYMTRSLVIFRQARDESCPNALSHTLLHTLARRFPSIKFDECEPAASGIPLSSLSPRRSSPCLSIDPSLSSRKPGPRFSPPPISSLHHLLPLLPPHCYRSARVFNKVESRLWLMQCWAGGALHETRVSPFSPNGSNQALIDPGLAHQGPLLSSHSSHLSLILPSHK